MDIETFVLCDFAQINQDKLTVVGAFNTVKTDTYPFFYTFYIACRLRYEKGEQGVRTILISISKENGEFLINPVEIPADIPAVNYKAHIYQLAINIDNIKFEKAGIYHVHLKVDDIVKSVPLYLEQL